jgi:8-oxo-dGTP pyrophosphatase MutT (NUDIX family)
MPSLTLIRERLEAFEPPVIGRPDLAQAAVAVLLRERAARAEVLFIERSTREGDPWSGHMAFPGGRQEEVDASARAAAVRETHEEIGIVVDGAEYLGLLGELQGNPRFRQSRLVVSAHVFHVPEPGPFVLEEREVADAMWFPVADLLDAARHVDYSTPKAGEMKFPGIVVGNPERHIVWGLTYRFVDIFMAAIQMPLPDRWGGFEGFRVED